MSIKKISIITVSKNDCNALKKTFFSLKKINKKYFEYILIDGNSNDFTKQIVKSNMEIIDKFVMEDDDGIYNAMNKGLSFATSSHVMFLNAGDTIIPESFEILLKSLKKGIFFYGDAYIKNGKSKRLLKAKSFTLYTLLMHGTSTVCHQSFIYERSLFKGYNEKYKLKAELFSYFSILEREHKVKNIKVPLVIYDGYGIGTLHFFKNSVELFNVIISQSIIFFPFAVFLFLKMLIYRLFLFLKYK